MTGSTCGTGRTWRGMRRTITPPPRGSGPSTTISDQPLQYSIEIKLSSGPNGYKGAGEVVDVTPRRLQKFEVKPGATYAWSTSSQQSGQAAADAEGLLTIPAVKVGAAWTKL